MLTFSRSPMSFELYMQCFDRGQPSGVHADTVKAAFTHIAAGSDRDHWRLVYDDANSCDVDVTRQTDQPDRIHALIVHRPCGDERLWDSLYDVLKSGRWVL